MEKSKSQTTPPMCDFHPPYARKTGPRVPRVYGSGPTLLCGVCGAWTPDWGGPSSWRPADTLAEAMEENDDR